MSDKNFVSLKVAFNQTTGKVDIPAKKEPTYLEVLQTHPPLFVPGEDRVMRTFYSYHQRRYKEKMTFSEFKARYRLTLTTRPSK